MTARLSYRDGRLAGSFPLRGFKRGEHPKLIVAELGKPPWVYVYHFALVGVTCAGMVLDYRETSPLFVHESELLAKIEPMARNPLERGADEPGADETR